MRLTPLDIQNHHFARRFSGVDPDEVDSFLRMVAEDYESLLHENEDLSTELRRLQVRVDHLSRDEKLLRETLVSAQAMGEDLRQTAVKESEVLLREAEVRAEKILDAAHRRAARIEEDIREMRGLRSRLAGALRSSIQSTLGLVEAMVEDVADEPVEDGAVTYLSRSAAERTRPGESA